DHEPLQYADLADWQNQLLENLEEGEAGHAYWGQQDLDVPAISLPLEKRPDETTPFQIAFITLSLDPKGTALLGETARSKEVSSSAILAVCWQVLLWRISDIRNVLIYHLSDGRQDEDLKGALGPLAKWLPIPMGLEPTSPVSRLWRRTNKA